MVSLLQKRKVYKKLIMQDTKLYVFQPPQISADLIAAAAAGVGLFEAIFDFFYRNDLYFL